MRKFIERESYLHRTAKELLATWLRESEHGKLDGISTSFCGLVWRKNRGIFVELPFYSTCNTWYFENSQYLSHLGYDKIQDFTTHFIPKSPLGKILFKPDITIFHQGRVEIIIEIVHKSDITQRKIVAMRKFFTPYFPEVYTIPAYVVMAQINKPSSLPFKRIYL